MIDITLENFESDLMAASMQVPVLLDIWAPWCGPCKQLGPVLEKLEAEYGGRFLLAKLNADDEPQIAGQFSQMFGVRSIPFCVMLAGGRPVDGFVGAIPEAQIREFLDKYVMPGDGLMADEPADDVDSVDEAGADGADPALAKLLEAIDRDPSTDEPRFELVKLLLERGQVEAAQAIFEPIAAKGTGPVPDRRVQAFGMYIEAAVVAPSARSAAELDAAIAANRRDFDARFELAQTHFGAGRFTHAMDALLEIIMRDKAWSDEKARKTYVGILEVMSKPVVREPKRAPGQPGQPGGPGAPGGAPGQPPKLEVAGKVEVQPADPVIDAYRRKLSMAIF
ncbi:tetratricopeptide repeat protein [Aquabacterium lacunae]|uniref:Tetratricopeptide repeat protein n=1 Tax=Aquabacterium lacunae TaxID=2528630 RepID=A0A4Q9GZL6_9BURK|nr:tetratricopeptide repeat protein [Aquabacterium lacunae]TBO31484.1 tetratricopeptide repeat protein [Aquabacterium lacunae]